MVSAESGMSATDGTLASLGRPAFSLSSSTFQGFVIIWTMFRCHKIIRLTTFVNILRDQLSHTLPRPSTHRRAAHTETLSHTRGGREVWRRPARRATKGGGGERAGALAAAARPSAAVARATGKDGGEGECGGGQGEGGGGEGEGGGVGGRGWVRRG